MPPFGGGPLWWLTPPPSPRFAVGLWVLSSVPHDSAGKRRVAYSVPRMGESPAQPDKGERPKAANHRNAVPADESKGIQPEPAGSRKQEADCFPLYIQRLLPADWFLLPIVSNAACTARILHRMRESTKVCP